MTGLMERRRACAPHGWEKPLGAYGVCADCKKIVHEKDIMSHSCGTWVSTGWEAFANPNNEPGYPGWKFAIGQESKKTGRRGVHKVSRTYTVLFMVAHDETLRHIGGPSPTEYTQACADAHYAHNKPAPGSNYWPGAEWDL